MKLSTFIAALATTTIVGQAHALFCPYWYGCNKIKLTRYNDEMCLPNEEIGREVKLKPGKCKTFSEGLFASMYFHVPKWWSNCQLIVFNLPQCRGEELYSEYFSRSRVRFHANTALVADDTEQMECINTWGGLSVFVRCEAKEHSTTFPDAAIA